MASAAPAELPWPERRLPVPVALLLAAAVVVAVVRTWLDLSQNSPQPVPRLVLHATEYASDFLVAAAVIGGTRRWLGGRVWLAAGGLLFATHGVFEQWSYAWARELTAVSPDTLAAYQAQAWLIASLMGMAALLAPLVLTAALWFSRSGPASASGRRGAAVLVSALLAAAGVAGQVDAIVQYGAAYPPAPALWGISVSEDAARLAGLGLLGITAVVTMPRGGATGNLLIAAGVALALMASAWQVWFQILIGVQNVAPGLAELAYQVPGAVEVMGMLVMAGGLVIGYRPWAPPGRGSAP